MSRAGGRAALPLAVLAGAALVAVVLLVLWLVRQAGEEQRTPRLDSNAARATDGAGGLPLPEFAVEPAAADARAGGEDGAAGRDSAISGAQSTPAASLRVFVVHSDGTPAAGAAVVAVAGDVVIDSQISGPDGSASFSITEDKIELYVGGATLRPQRFEIEPAHGELRLELHGGAFVGGIALLDGQPPEEPLELVLESNDDEHPWTLPKPVTLALKNADHGRPGPLGLQTTAGRFLFGGLPRDWAGWIRIPYGFRIEGGAETELFLSEPATSLVLRLTRTGALTGRVLLPDSTPESVHPARKASLELRVDFVDSGNTTMASAATDENGRFHVALYGGGPVDASLRIRAADGAGRLTWKAEALDPFVVHDLGDIVLEATGSVEFLVRDEAGQPLPGAVATALDETRARSKPTNADGRGVLSDLMPGTNVLRIDALGRHSGEVAIAPPIEVVLSPAPSLDLRLVDESGATPGRVVVTYGADELLFDGDTSGGIDPVQVSLGATRLSRWGWNGGHAHGQATLEDSARCQLTRIRAGVPFTLAVRDRYGTVLRTPERLVLGSAEQRQLEWTVNGSPRTVTVIVLTTEGVPVPEAQVWLRGSDPARPEMDWVPDQSLEPVSDTGEARFTNVFAERVSLQASANRPGLGTAWLLDQYVPPEGAHVELRLAPGRTIDIEVVGADGARHHVDGVSMVDGPYDLAAQQLETGLYRLVDAPPGMITLEAYVNRRRYSAQHESSQPRARIELPALGSLSARWTVPLQADQPYSVHARCLQPDDWSKYFMVHDGARASNGPIGFGDLLPGEYEVVLREGRGLTGEDLPVSQVARVTVTAGEATEVVLEP